MSFNAESLFNKIQQQEQQAATGVGRSFNSLILKPKVNCNYSLRLLWLQPEGSCTREYPMINQYVHHFWDDNAVGSKDQVVYCPTSQYIKGETKDGFSSCPVCAKCSELYKASNEGSSSAATLYKTFRRTFRGYVPVYVVNGPEDVVGKVMILSYGKMFKEFFDRKIFGVMPKRSGEEQQQPISADDIIGLDAFLYAKNDGTVVTDGYNFNIQVTAKKMIIDGKSIDMPQYTMDFSRRSSTITHFGDEEITIDVMNSLNSRINFDNDFYNISSSTDLNKFKLKYIDAEETVSETEDAEPAQAVVQNINPFKKPVVEEKPVVVPAQEENVVNNDDDDIDVDALIDGL
jgi:hypothetical protein